MPALDERFEFIRQLGNVFLVRPEILKSYITEDYLGKIDSKLLRPYLAQRSDWGQFDYDGDGEAGKMNVGEAETRGLRDRLGMGKLAAMMKELETLRGSGAATPTGNAASQTPVPPSARSAGGAYIPVFALGAMY